MTTSHETELDFSHFLKSLDDLFSTLNIDFKNIFKNVMIDACQAMANCIKTNYTEFSIIMCYFHLKSNIKNQKTPQIGPIPKDEYPLVMQEISNLHMSLNQLLKKQKWNRI